MTGSPIPRAPREPGLRVHLVGATLHFPGVLPPGRPLDLVLDGGTRLALLGRSGQGKSLLARLALGRLPGRPVRVSGTWRAQCAGIPAMETVLDDLAPGSDAPGSVPLRRSLARYLPQGGRERLVPSWTVAAHLDAVERAAPGAGARGSGWLDRLEVPLDRIGGLPPPALSEGMVRRVLLALALATAPALVVLDEPTAGLDAGAAEAVATALETALQGAALLLVTHDLSLARRLAQSFALVVDGCVQAACDTLDPDGPLGAHVRAARRFEGPPA